MQLLKKRPYGQRSSLYKKKKFLPAFVLLSMPKQKVNTFLEKVKRRQKIRCLRLVVCLRSRIHMRLSLTLTLKSIEYKHRLVAVVKQKSSLVFGCSYILGSLVRQHSYVGRLTLALSRSSTPERSRGDIYRRKFRIRAGLEAR